MITGQVPAGGTVRRSSRLQQEAGDESRRQGLGGAGGRAAVYCCTRQGWRPQLVWPRGGPASCSCSCSSCSCSSCQAGLDSRLPPPAPHHTLHCTHSTSHLQRLECDLCQAKGLTRWSPALLTQFPLHHTILHLQQPSHNPPLNIHRVIDKRWKFETCFQITFDPFNSV